MKISIIGLGRMGLRHVQVARNLGLDIVGLCDASEQALASPAPGCRCRRRLLGMRGPCCCGPSGLPGDRDDRPVPCAARRARGPVGRRHDPVREADGGLAGRVRRDDRDLPQRRHPPRDQPPDAFHGAVSAAQAHARRTALRRPDQRRHPSQQFRHRDERYPLFRDVPNS